jgi:ribosomal protein S27AE
MSFIDPSWCARINAHRAQPEPVPPPAPAELPVPPDPVPLKRREIPSVHVCELCGTVMYDHNCKIVCPNCGYKRDCSDP